MQPGKANVRRSQLTRDGYLSRGAASVKGGAVEGEGEGDGETGGGTGAVERGTDNGRRPRVWESLRFHRGRG